LTTAAVLASLGSHVVCVERSKERREAAASGKCPFFEPGLEELLVRGLHEGSLRFCASVTEGIAQAEAAFIAVGTPEGPDGFPDLSALRAAAREAALAAEPGLVIVNKSTVPVGSVRLVAEIVKEEAPGKGIRVVSCPEFLREGSAIHDMLTADRVVIGSDDPEAAASVARLYEPLGRPLLVTTPESAELIKYASNCFLALKISYANMIAEVCEASGADVGEVTRGMGMDGRIGPEFLQAGLGWGGSCFPKDIKALASFGRQCGAPMDLIEASASVNSRQPLRHLDRLEAEAGGLAGKTVAVLGLSFKPNTDDVREATSIAIIDSLLARGATVTAYDPVCGGWASSRWPQIRIAPTPFEAAAGADAVILVTEWNEFRMMDLELLGQKMRTRLLFDGRRLYNRERAERAGFRYLTAGG
jgi:UDPglucose 6-dehydrogenase